MTLTLYALCDTPCCTLGKHCRFNPYAWNKVVNMVFIEQPVGVGFSVATGSIDYGDDQAATDNYKFIKVFLEKFDTYSSNDFYILSESYGGHYMPTLAKKLVVNGGVNFKGVALGNPLTYMPCVPPHIRGIVYQAW